MTDPAVYACLETLATQDPGEVEARERHVFVPSPRLSEKWAPSRVVYCARCGSPVRGNAIDAIGAVLGDVNPWPAAVDCLFHSSEAVSRSRGIPATRRH